MIEQHYCYQPKAANVNKIATFLSYNLTITFKARAPEAQKANSNCLDYCDSNSDCKKSL